MPRRLISAAHDGGRFRPNHLNSWCYCSKPHIRSKLRALKRIPTLDGWRGTAIAMVLFSHIQGATDHSLMNTGQHGVTIFFVLSGFLITNNLITRRGNLKNFYIRRFFRLMPVVWTYLALLAVVSCCTGVPLFQGGEIQPCLLFYRNYVGPIRGAMTGHFWSLSIDPRVPGHGASL